MQIPNAPAFLVRNHDVWQWEIRDCPLCHGCHWHGSGYITEDPRKSLGHRVEHCAPPSKVCGYELIDADPERTAKLCLIQHKGVTHVEGSVHLQ